MTHLDITGIDTLERVERERAPAECPSVSSDSMTKGSERESMRDTRVMADMAVPTIAHPRHAAQESG